MEPDSRGSLTPQTSIPESKVSHVRDKIGLPRPVARDFSSFSVVVAFFTVEPVAEFEAVAENEIDIAETVDHLGRVGERDKTGSLGSCALKCWCQAFRGGEKRLPSCHSKVRFAPP